MKRTELVWGALAGPLFTVAWLFGGATRVAYDPLRHPISSLAIGIWGWTQALAFIVTGLLLLAFADGLRRAFGPRNISVWGPRLIGIVGLGLIGAGLFTAAPLNGYPPGTPALPLHYGAVGRLHRLFSAFVFLGLPATCFVFGRSFARRQKRGWARYSRVTGVAFIAFFVVTTAAFAQVPVLVAYAGLLQRVTLTVGWLWLTLLALYALRMLPVRPNTHAP